MNIWRFMMDVLVGLAVNFAVIRLFTTPLQAVKCCYYSNNGPYFLFRVDYCRFDIWLLFFYLNRDIFPISIQGAFSSALSTVSSISPHQPTPTNATNATNQQQPRHTLTRSLILLSYFIISSLYTITAIAHATRSPLSSYILIYNIIYLATILYPI